jgi:hypothetical protein
MAPSYVALWIVVCFQTLLVIALLKELGRLRRLESFGEAKEDHLPIGDKAPFVSGFDRRARAPINIEILERRGGALVFLSPDCYTCQDLVGSLEQFTDDEAGDLLVVCIGEHQPCSQLLRAIPRSVHTLSSTAERLPELYHVSAYPTAVIMDDHLRIRKYGHPRDIDELRDLLAERERDLPALEISAPT